MSISLEQLQTWLDSAEGERLEFKEAKNRYDFQELVKYCTALANEGGGRVILGVTNKRPRRVIGSQAFAQPERTRKGLIERLHLGIDFEEIHHPDGRVLVFEVPPRSVGVPIQYKGIYWMRSADSLVPMSEDRLREVFSESGHDFSADVCTAASFSDLDSSAIEEFRKRWVAKSANQALAALSEEQLLTDAEALVDGEPTYAALVLFGTYQALGKHLAQAEVIFEYRSSEASGPAQDRTEYRQGFFTFYDSLWRRINLRNDIQPYQEGLFVLNIFVKKRGVYTRKRGLDRETNKALLLKHIKDNQNEGSPLQELMQVLPGLSRAQVQTLLRELRASAQIHSLGMTRAGRWYPGSDSEPIESEDPE